MGTCTFLPTVASGREVGQTALSNNINCHSCICFDARETELSVELLQTKSTVTTAQLMCSDFSHGPLIVHLVSQHKLLWRIVYRVSSAAELHSP